MAAVTIKKSPQGAVVIYRGFGFVTASNLMKMDEAVKLAAQLEFARARKHVTAGGR